MTCVIPNEIHIYLFLQTNPRSLPVAWQQGRRTSPFPLLGLIEKYVFKLKQCE
jgi:hypothetical protein